MKSRSGSKMPAVLVAVAAGAVLIASDVAAQVDQAWVRTYNGPAGDQNDAGHAIRVDPNGDVVVAGFSLRDREPINADGIVLKYDPQGQLLWEHREDSGGPDVAEAMELDGQGNILVVAEVDPTYSNQNLRTYKLSPSGQRLWAQDYSTAGSARDFAAAITVDDQGNVYVVGDGASADPGSTGAIVLKYSPDGVLLWDEVYSGPSTGDDWASDVAVDAVGQVYIVGGSHNGLSYDIVLLKFSPDGQLLWERRWTDPFQSGSDAFGFKVEIDSTGNPIVAGRFWAGFKNFDDVILIKYDPTGAELWSDRIDGPGNDSDTVGDLKVGPDDAIYLGFNGEGASGTTEAIVRRYEPDGSQAWQTEYSRFGRGDSILSLVVVPDGSILVAGYSGSMGSDFDQLAFRLNPDGSLAWAQTYAGPTESNDFAFDIDFDAAGGVYTTGDADFGATRIDIVTVKYAEGSTADLILTQTALHRGQPATFTVEGAAVGDRIYFLYSFTGVGTGPCPPVLGGLCLDLLNPITVFGTSIADSTGTARLTRTIPANAPLRDVHTQAVAPRGIDGEDSVKSNTVTDTIQP